MELGNLVGTWNLVDLELSNEYHEHEVIVAGIRNSTRVRASWCECISGFGFCAWGDKYPFPNVCRTAFRRRCGEGYSGLLSHGVPVEVRSGTGNTAIEPYPFPDSDSDSNSDPITVSTAVIGEERDNRGDFTTQTTNWTRITSIHPPRYG